MLSYFPLDLPNHRVLYECRGIVTAVSTRNGAGKRSDHLKSAAAAATKLYVVL